MCFLNFIPYEPNWRDLFILTLILGGLNLVGLAINLAIIKVLRRRKMKFADTAEISEKEVTESIAIEIPTRKVSINLILSIIGILITSVIVVSLFAFDEYYNLNYLYLINPIMLSILFILFSTIFVKRIKDKKIVFSLLAIAICVLLGIVAFVVAKNTPYFNYDYETYRVSLFSILILLFILQIPLMISNENFVEFFGLRTKTLSNDRTKYSLKRLNFTFYLLITLLIFSISYIPLFDRFDENSSIDLPYNYIHRYLIIIVNIIALYMWFYFTFLKKKEFHRGISFALGLLLPIVIFLSCNFISAVDYPYISSVLRFDWSMLTSDYDILISTGFYAFFFLLYGIPIGTNSKKKDFLIIYGVHAIIWLVVILVSGLAFGNFDSSTIGSKFTAIAILQIPLVFIMMFLGALYGYFFRKQFSRLKTTNTSQS
ncbi:MAG: hypothetical protein FK733_19515 [Asgard group archaeon]|nr:hypothetical protein [Asgard group archaeon]